MAALFWNSDRRTLPEGVNLFGVKAAIEKELQQIGAVGIRRTELDVSCSMPGVFLSIGHFQIDGITFWEVVMGSGDDGDLTRDTVNRVADRVRRIHFF